MASGNISKAKEFDSEVAALPLCSGEFVNVLSITKHINMDTEGLDSEYSELEFVLQDHHTPSLAVSHPKITTTPDLQCLTPRTPYSQSCSVSPQDHHNPQTCSVLPQDHHTPSLAMSHPKITTTPRLAVSHPKITILPVLQCLTPRPPHPPHLQCLTPRSQYPQSCSAVV